MIIDTSAFIAILRGEPERIPFLEIMDAAKSRAVAAPTLLETSMVLIGKQNADIAKALDDFLAVSDIDILPFTADHLAVAREAFLRYGKGRHPASLNFGGCIAYATARLEAMPLLFKGEDFRLTDVEAAA